MQISLGAFGFRWVVQGIKSKDDISVETVYRSDKTVCRSVCLQKAGEVLGVDTNVAVDVAMNNATLNEITHCSYLAGDAEVTIPELAKKIKYDSVRAVVTCCINNLYRSKCVVKFVYSVHY